jgi:hypothetical protein
LTIPVQVKGKYYQKIKDTEISDLNWGKEHWKSLTYNYIHSPYFQDYKDIFESLYLNCQGNNLSQINYKFLVSICRILGINTKISWSMDYCIVEGKTERLVSLCKQASATEYISGPAAAEYIDDNLFQWENIKVSYIDYSNYPDYQQLFPPFEHGVSVLDLIFNEGRNSKRYLKSFN